jgi:DNA-binding MarR family transcriptional regulator
MPDQTLNEQLSLLVTSFGFNAVFEALRHYRSQKNTEIQIQRLTMTDRMNIEGKTPSEIAAVLGLTPATIKSNLKQIARYKRHPQWRGWDDWAERRRTYDSR